MTALRRPGWHLFLWAFAIVTIVLLIGPLLLVFPLSVTESSFLTWPPRGFTWRWFEQILSNPRWTSGFTNSLVVAVTSAAVATVLGTGVALGLVRGRLRFASAANVLVLAPLAIPLIIFALGFYQFSVYLGIYGSFLGLSLAHAVLSVPFVAVTVSASLRTVPRELELAGSGLGASPARVFARITLPLILPGVISGAIFAFLMSWDEVVVALFNTTIVFRTLPVVMWEQIRESVNPTAAAVSVVFLVVTIALVSVASAIQMRQNTPTGN